MELVISEALSEDIKELNSMLTDLIQDEKKYDININKHYLVENYYEQFLEKKDTCIIVAKNNLNEILGYAFGYIMDYGTVYDNQIAQLDAIYIKKEYRKKGIAKKIIEYFVEWSKRNEVKYIELKVCKDNIGAINLYESEGFTTDKLILKKKL